MPAAIFSCTRQEHAGWIKRLRRLSDQLQAPLAILQDLGGPKVRIREVASGSFKLKGVVSRATRIIFPTRPGSRSRAAEGCQEIREAASYTACKMAPDLEAATIISHTDGGGTGCLSSRFRPANRTSP